MSKHVILHPDDFAKLKLDSPVTMDDGITIERDRFGVTVSGEAKVLTFPDYPLPMPRVMPIPNFQPERDLSAAWRLGRLMLPPPPRWAIDFTHLGDFRTDDQVAAFAYGLSSAIIRAAARQARKLVSLKAKAYAQHRLDLASRVRTRKRRAELARRESPSFSR